MARFFGIALLVLMILLAPPSVLALISNNAVPGEPAYPIKRVLEAGILVITSVHPSLKAAFTVERSNRRFLEAKSLIDTGKSENVTESLGELVTHTKDAAKEITKVSGGTSKKQLVKKLTEQVKTYDKELEKAQKKIISKASYETPSQITIPAPTQAESIQPGVYQTPTSITTAPADTTVKPAVSPAPSPTPVKSPTPAPAKTAEPIDLIQIIEETREDLREINEELESVDTSSDSEPPYGTPAAEEAPPVSSADEESPAQESEPQPIPTEAPVPTLEPTPEDSPAIRQIKQNNLDPTPENSNPSKVETNLSP